MALEDLLTRLEMRGVDTGETPRNQGRVAAKPVPVLGCTPDTPDTPQNGDGGPAGKTGGTDETEPIACTRRVDAIESRSSETTVQASVLPMPAAHEAAIRTWLAYVKDADVTVNDEVLAECRSNVYARAYFLRLAEGVPHLGEPDDRPRCNQCANLTPSGHCLAAWRGEILAHSDFMPVPDLPLRCEAYKPMDVEQDDPEESRGCRRGPILN